MSTITIFIAYPLTFILFNLCLCYPLKPIAEACHIILDPPHYWASTSISLWWFTCISIVHTYHISQLHFVKIVCRYPLFCYVHLCLLWQVQFTQC